MAICGGGGVVLYKMSKDKENTLKTKHNEREKTNYGNYGLLIYW